MLFTLWFVVPTQPNNWAEQHLQNSPRLTRVPALPTSPAPWCWRSPVPSAALRLGMAKLVPITSLLDQAFLARPSQTTSSPALAQTDAGCHVTTKSRLRKGARAVVQLGWKHLQGTKKVRKDPKSTFQKRHVLLAMLTDPLGQFGFPDASPRGRT